MDGVLPCAAQMAVEPKAQKDPVATAGTPARANGAMSGVSVFSIMATGVE